MLIIMIYYIISKLVSLVVTGSTREVLVIETKDYLTHKIKTIMCNEILINDEYLTEDRLIRLTELQENRKNMSAKDKEIDKYVLSLEDNKNNLEDVLAELKENVNEKLGIDNDAVNKIKLTKDEEKLVEYKVTKKELQNNLDTVSNLKKNKDYKYMMNKFFSVDGNTSIDKNIFKPKELLAIDNSIKKDNRYPQILIYHTHGSEAYVNSRKGKKEDTVVGVGAYLKDILVDRYGYNVIHNISSYDVVNGRWNRNSYETALAEIEKILRDNPSIEVVIDLHRDSGKEKVITKINGVNVAKVMFFNGVSRSKTAKRKDLPNQYLQENIALSLQMQMQSMSMYKNFTKKVYLKGYRYNQHVSPKCTLIEVGNNKNTVSEAKYAMLLYASILDEVLS